MKLKKTCSSEQQSLFSAGLPQPADTPLYAPLAARMRPRCLAEFTGQVHLLGPGKFLDRLIQSKTTQSLIFWGPPGCGKTTLAHILSAEWGIPIIALSAVLVGLKETREAIETARQRKRAFNQSTVLFIDEIHRFNKAQQDALLPHVEEGRIILIGATTENPSFAVTAPLLSRMQVLRLEPLNQQEIETILDRALKDIERGLGKLTAALDHGVSQYFAHLADSDARTALNLLEIAVSTASLDSKGQRLITRELVEQVSQKRALLYDRVGDEHYNLISALHKSMRGSDPDASLYYLTRMLLAGEDPLYIGRRLIRFASEDVGLADPQAIGLTVAAVEAYERLGSPEGELALVEAATYLATAPKSNSLYTAYKASQELVHETGALPVPLKLRNAPTGLMKIMGYGKDYQYPHDFEDAYVSETYLPDSIGDTKIYHPSDRGYEQTIAHRMKEWTERNR